MAEYAPIRVTPEVGERLRAASFELSTKLGRRVTYGETVDIALAALALETAPTADELDLADQAGQR